MRETGPNAGRSVFRLTGKAMPISIRHGPACPGYLFQRSAVIGGPDKPGHDDGKVHRLPVDVSTL
jgi:hypothetical protein